MGETPFSLLMTSSLKCFQREFLWWDWKVTYSLLKFSTSKKRPLYLLKIRRLALQKCQLVPAAILHPVSRYLQANVSKICDEKAYTYAVQVVILHTSSLSYELSNVVDVDASDVIDVLNVEAGETSSEHDVSSRGVSHETLCPSQDAKDHAIFYGDDLKTKI